MIKIVPKFTSKEVKEILEKKAKQLDAALYLALQRVGEEFIRNARSTNTYKDRTGNLRSSIGYIIMLNGVQLTENFEGKKDGVVFGRKVAVDEALKLTKKVKRGYIFVGVAGMSYAAAVESRGFDVITGSSKIAESNLRSALARINLKASNIPLSK